MSVGTTYQQVLDFQYVYSLVVWSIYDVFFSMEIMKHMRKEVFPSPFLFLFLSLIFPSQMTSSCFSQNIFYKYPFSLDMWQRIYLVISASAFHFCWTSQPPLLRLFHCCPYTLTKGRTCEEKQGFSPPCIVLKEAEQHVELHNQPVGVSV